MRAAGCSCSSAHNTPGRSVDDRPTPEKYARKRRLVDASSIEVMVMPAILIARPRSCQSQCSHLSNGPFMAETARIVPRDDGKICEMATKREATIDDLYHVE